MEKIKGLAMWHISTLKMLTRRDKPVMGTFNDVTQGNIERLAEHGLVRLERVNSKITNIVVTPEGRAYAKAQAGDVAKWTTAGDILKDALERMGADKWMLDDGDLYSDGDGIVGSGATSLLFARPAWRDGEGWFVLPDGWQWARGSFIHTKISMLNVYQHDGRWLYSYPRCPIHRDTYATAPDAFRAAEKWIAEQES